MRAAFTSTTPIGFINKAEAYRAGAQLLAKDLTGFGGWAGDPTRYLYYHGIELYLKAALISAGKTEAQLKVIGHSFAKLANESNSEGLGLNRAEDLNVMALIDADQNYIRSRYHYVGYFSTPTIQALDGTAHALATLSVQMVRRCGQRVRKPLPALPLEYRFQTG
ncbi:MAG: hypothetical protein QUV71_00180 [Rhizobium sp.]|nr:hypothetical protein [Rhizobium sp.]MDM8013685.1 hypothetical protein [Rhizobium sp.]